MYFLQPEEVRVKPKTKALKHYEIGLRELML
jgi:hypothetical protein